MPAHSGHYPEAFKKYWQAAKLDFSKTMEMDIDTGWHLKSSLNSKIAKTSAKTEPQEKLMIRPQHWNKMARTERKGHPGEYSFDLGSLGKSAYVTEYTRPKAFEFNDKNGRPRKVSYTRESYTGFGPSGTFEEATYNNRMALVKAVFEPDDENLADFPYTIYEQEGCGHIKHLKYADDTQTNHGILEVTFEDGTVSDFFNVPSSVGGQLLYFAATKQTTGMYKKNGKYVPKHLLGVAFWKLVRIQHSHRRALYPFEYKGRSTSAIIRNNPTIIKKLKKDLTEDQKKFYDPANLLKDNDTVTLVKDGNFSEDDLKDFEDYYEQHRFFNANSSTNFAAIADADNNSDPGVTSKDKISLDDLMAAESNQFDNMFDNEVGSDYAIQNDAAVQVNIENMADKGGRNMADTAAYTTETAAAHKENIEMLKQYIESFWDNHKDLAMEARLRSNYNKKDISGNKSRLEVLKEHDYDPQAVLIASVLDSKGDIANRFVNPSSRRDLMKVASIVKGEIPKYWTYKQVDKDVWTADRLRAVLSNDSITNKLHKEYFKTFIQQGDYRGAFNYLQSHGPTKVVYDNNNIKAVIPTSTKYISENAVFMEE